MCNTFSLRSRTCGIKDITSSTSWVDHVVTRLLNHVQRDKRDNDMLIMLITCHVISSHTTIYVIPVYTLFECFALFY